MNLDPEPDIVEVIIQACTAVGLDQDAARLIELAIRAEYGGLRVRIPKRKKHLTPELRQQAYRDSIAKVPTEVITSNYGIDRTTLYRLLKKKGG